MPLPASRGATSSRALPRSQEACVRALPADFIDHLLRAEQTFSRPVSLLCCLAGEFCCLTLLLLQLSHNPPSNFFIIIIVMMIIIVTIAGIFFPAQSWALFISRNSCDGAPGARFRASVAGQSGCFTHYDAKCV